AGAAPFVGNGPKRDQDVEDDPDVEENRQAAAGNQKRRQRQGRRDEVGYHQLEGLEHPVLIRRPGDAGGNQSNERCVQDDQTVLENALVGDEEPNDGQQQRQQQRNPQRAQRRDDGLQTQVFEREVNHQQPEGGAQLLAPRRLPATLGREGPGSRL